MRRFPARRWRDSPRPCRHSSRASCSTSRQSRSAARTSHSRSMSPLTVSPRSLNLGSCFATGLSRSAAICSEMSGRGRVCIWPRRRPNFAYIASRRLPALVGGLLDFRVDRESVVPVRQPGEAICFGEQCLGIRRLRVGSRPQENSDSNNTDAADQTGVVARHGSLSRFAGALPIFYNCEPAPRNHTRYG